MDSMSKRSFRWAGFLVLPLLVAGSFVSAAYAQTLQSTNYQFDESVLGGGGLGESNSANYQSTSSIGEAATGASASNGFQIEAGNKTSPDPVLKFSVDNTGANFGSFSASAAATTTATFSVSNYTSWGYAVQIVGDPPANGAHSIDAMASTDSSISGLDQFGINLVANTSPTSLGANPNQGQFGFGVAAPNYATSDQYRYVSGETIATAPKSSGITQYTISYIVNVESLTPGGQYTTKQTLICTGTF